MMVLNNTNTTTDNNTSGSNSSSGKQPRNMIAVNKADSSRKISHVQNDPNQRRTPVPKAWVGVNPITNRSNTPLAQNGAAQNKITQSSDRADNGTFDSAAHSRLQFLTASAVGNYVTLTLTNGDAYKGIFFGALLEKSEPEYLLKMTQIIKRHNTGESNGLRDGAPEYVGAGEDNAMSFKAKDVIDLPLESSAIKPQDKLVNGSTAGFRTDTDISGKRGGQERELQPWIAPSDGIMDQSLGSTTGQGTWDQFQANESLFGVKSDYDENYYTSRIDRSHPEYRQRAAEADRIARRMGESSKDEANEGEGLDEEDKYSGVRRDTTDYPPLQSTPNRYQPPARRPPTSKPTVAGAPVDPAIISSQVARSGEDRSVNKEKIGRAQVTEGAINSSPATNAADAFEKSQEASKDTVAISKEASQARPALVNATATVEADALKAFRQFSEKQKTRMADDRRARVMQDKNVKLNDLRGFSKNFKLNTPVPKDLVPILAKDPKKQEAILENAQRNAAEQKAAALKQGQKVTEHTTLKQGGERRDNSKVQQSANDRSEQARHGPPPRAPQAALPLRDRQNQQAYPLPSLPPTEQGLSQRLNQTQRERHNGNPTNVPAPLPIHTSRTPSRPSANAARANNSSGSTSLRTPTSATSGKFNVKAHEFVPNPAASAFMPFERPSTSSSPRANGKARPASQAASSSEFWGKKKPLSPKDRPSIKRDFNPLRRLRERAEKDGKSNDYAANGGIAPAYSTPVTWTLPKDGEEGGKSYKDMFDGLPPSGGPSRSPTASPMNGTLMNPHHIASTLQQAPHGMQASQAMYHASPPHHLYPGMPHQYDDRSMHSSPAYGTPRMPAAYPFPMAMGQPLQGQMPVNFQYPGMPGSHPQMMNPGGPQPPPFRQYGPAPQFIPNTGPPLTAPMMVAQGSQGPYMPQPGPVAHVPFYTSNAAHYGNSQPNSGYPSPGRSAPMMMHSSSFQGQNGPGNNSGNQYAPHMYSPAPQANGQIRGYPSPQGQYSQSPQQQYNYPPQPQRMPSHGYGSHPSQMPLQHHPPPGPGEAEGLK